jgi:hypothetical protein
MKTRNSKSKFGAGILGLFFLFGVGVMMSPTVQAQGRDDRDGQDARDRGQDQDRNRDQDRDRGGRRGRNWDGYPNWGGSFQLRQTALNAGYNEGHKQGLKDRKKGQTHDPESFSAYQKATSDYSSKLGDRELYRRYYREAFPTGYKDAYDGY